ncbi:hypothetical protein DPEC_G00016630 [Dallia pectoralis]|uniref:Uncharacterized protein n=1 Tax=Dallia pectoralis TaxID=75939 RepID=A0ACC2HPB9_DALPE|nr:hypothetical protein DPEC_G00016630 [Dallia pectoralis]
MEDCNSKIAVAYALVLPDISVTRYATLERSFGKVDTCSSKMSEHCEMNERQVSGSPSYRSGGSKQGSRGTAAATGAEAGLKTMLFWDWLVAPSGGAALNLAGPPATVNNGDDEEAIWNPGISAAMATEAGVSQETSNRRHGNCITAGDI